MPNRSAVTVSGLVGIALIGLVAIAKGRPKRQQPSERRGGAIEPRLWPACTKRGFASHD